jgi:hypothetical protein
MKQISNIALLAIAILFVMTGCDKTKPYDIIAPPALAHFISTNQVVSYYVRNSATDSFVVNLGTTDVSNADRTITYKISSPTGAVNGTDYTVVSPASGNTVVFKAGTVLSTIVIKGKFTSYSSGKKDTLVFTLAAPSLASAKFSDTIKLVLQRYCDVVPANFTGLYKKCFDIQAGQPNYGPYTVNMPSAGVTATGATTGYVMISNFWDVGGADIRVDLNWTNPANFTTSVPAQFLYTDATYGAATITGVGTGSFSSCDNTFSISYKVTVSAGSFGNFITTIAR